MYHQSSNKTTPDELFHLCWKHQDCGTCLDENEAPCNWCPVSSTCIPNTAMIHILAPIWNEDVCPHWSERWEVRSRPLGCHVSTITFLTAIVAFLVGLLTVGIVVTGWKFGSWARERWRAREEGWWRGWRLKLVDVMDARRDGNGAATRPLLEG